jgi:hypothetical protein
MQDFILTPKKSSMFRLLLFGIGMIFFGGIIITLDDLIARIFGGFMIIVMIPYVLTSAYRLFVSKPLLIVNENGIFLYQHDILIPWNYVKGFLVSPVFSIYWGIRADISKFLMGMPIKPEPSFLRIDVNKYDELIAHLPLYKKLWLKIRWNNNFTIEPWICGYKAGDLKYTLQKYLNKYKTILD